MLSVEEARQRILDSIVVLPPEKTRGFRQSRIYPGGGCVRRGKYTAVSQFGDGRLRCNC